MKLFGGQGPEELVDVDEQELRAARVAAVRKTRWEELEESHLVPRGPRKSLLVHEPSDAVYGRKRGSIFENGRAAVEFASPDDSSIAFFVTTDQRVIVLERMQMTWSEIVARRARTAARARPAL